MSLDDYLESRLERFAYELETMTEQMEALEYYGSAEGLVYARISGKGELLGVEITPSELYPENAQRLQQLILEAVQDAHRELELTRQSSLDFISEDLALGC